MNYISQKFSQTENVEFFRVLRTRVGSYFHTKNRSKYGNWSMRMKTVMMFTLYLTPYVFILSGNITQPVMFVALWVTMGLGKAGIGLSIMHDANHGAYSSRKRINKFLGYSMNLIGANAEIWKLQHNILHHTYTNIHGADDDIHTPKILRFSPYDKRYWIHRYQFLYVWFFYGISTLSWMTSKEFFQAFRYKKMGLVKGKHKFRNLLTQLALWKVFYFTYMLVLPITFPGICPWAGDFIIFLMRHCTGLIIGEWICTCTSSAIGSEGI